MAKLYPPIISGTLPAFFLEETNVDRTVKITVPFTMNRAVSAAQITGFALRIKTVQNSNYLYTATMYNENLYNLEGSPYVTFVLKTSENTEERELLLRTLKIGTFYKLQLAYIDNTGEIGNFSSVGISKFTTKPTLTINDLKSNITNTHLYNYVGFYDQTGGDTTEKVYTYRFDIYDENDNIIATSGDKIHNTTMDTDLNFSYDTYTYYQDLILDKAYKIQYSVVTANNLSISSPLYKISQKILIKPDLNADIVATSNFDDGYITVKLVGHLNDNKVEEPVSGSFLLSRSSEDSNYLLWEELTTFKLISETPSRLLWTDFTAMQGKNYKYSIQQYNDQSLYSSRIISNEVYSDFEDAFLYDGERQLKIRYNPKMGNIKTNRLETKVDTLGHKYPFFFRNSNVDYKEFTISGLLSFLGDNNFFFLSKEELGLVDEPHRHSTSALKDQKLNDSVSENIARERTFKMTVLEWLNNGKPKLFRSPTEGNFIVRLMKTTLNPENKLGRLLHTFNGTAYEIADYNYLNLIKYNFINIIKDNDIKVLSWETIKFVQDGVYQSGITLNRYPAISAEFIGMRPGQMIKFIYENSREEIVMIGPTGNYKIKSEIPIIDISLLNSNSTYKDGVYDLYLTGSMTYSFYTTIQNHFNSINNVDIISVPVHQFIGQHEDIIREIEYINDNGNWIKNPKIELLNISKVKAYKRFIEDLTYQDNKYYFGQTNIEFNPINANIMDLFRVGSYEEITQYSPIHKEWNFNPESYIDYTQSPDQISLENFNYNFTVSVNNSEIYTTLNPVEFNSKNFGEIKQLSSNNGTVIDISYQIKNIDFTIEDNDIYPVYSAKRTYNNLQDKLNTYYEVIGTVGQYNSTIEEIDNQEDILLGQLNQKKDLEKEPYTEKQNSLQEVFERLYGNEEKGIVGEYYTAYREKREFIINQINAINENGVSNNEQNKLFQFQQALYVLDYEYQKTYDKNYAELTNNIAELNQKKANIDSLYQAEESYIRNKYAVQRETLEKKKEDLLAKAEIMFPEVTIEQWEDYEFLYNAIEIPLKEELQIAYKNYILSLIQSQQMEAQIVGGVSNE